MVKFITKSVCMALIAMLCVGVNAQNTPNVTRKHAPQLFKAAQQTPPTRGDVIYTEGFEGTTGTNLPAGWTKTGTAWIGFTNANDDLYQVTGADAAHTGDRTMARSWANANQGAWAFSPAIALEAGNQYTIKFWYEAPGYPDFGEFDNFEVKIGQDPSASGMSNLLFELINTMVVNWTQSSSTFAPAASGDYYLGFHCTNGAAEGIYILIDDIEVSDDGGAPDPCPAITNLASEIQGTDVKLTWTAATGSPTGYKVYDGSTALGTVTTTEYVTKNLSVGVHTLGVEALYDDNCLPVKVTTVVDMPVSLNPVKNLDGTCIDGTLNLTWIEPDENGTGFNDWLTYTTGSYGGVLGSATNGNYYWAQRWSPTDLETLGIATAEVTKIQFGFHSHPQVPILSGTYEVKIWQGTSATTPGTEVFTQDVPFSSLVEGGWNEVILTAPVAIDASLELWIGVHSDVNVGAYAIPYDNTPTVPDVNLFKSSTPTGAWTKVETVGGWDSGNIMVAGFVVGEAGEPIELTRYDVYKDDAKFGETTATTFTKDDMPDGKSNYCIVAVYENDAQSQKVCKEIACIACPSVTGTKAEIADCKTATISWTAADGAKEYKIERNGVAAVTVEASPYTEEFDFVDGETYTWTITTICTSGKEADGVIAETTANCVGINELANSVLIYPNPTSGTITITADNFSKVEIYNTVGQLIETKTVETFDVASYNTGIYFFKVYDVYNNNVTKRVMVAK